MYFITPASTGFTNLGTSKNPDIKITPETLTFEFKSKNVVITKQPKLFPDKNKGNSGLHYSIIRCKSSWKSFTPVIPTRPPDYPNPERSHKWTSNPCNTNTSA